MLVKLCDAFSNVLIVPKEVTGGNVTCSVKTLFLAAGYIRRHVTCSSIFVLSYSLVLKFAIFSRISSLGNTSKRVSVKINLH